MRCGVATAPVSPRRSFAGPLSPGGRSSTRCSGSGAVVSAIAAGQRVTSPGGASSRSPASLAATARAAVPRGVTSAYPVAAQASAGSTRGGTANGTASAAGARPVVAVASDSQAASRFQRLSSNGDGAAARLVRSRSKDVATVPQPLQRRAGATVRSPRSSLATAASTVGRTPSSSSKAKAAPTAPRVVADAVSAADALPPTPEVSDALPVVVATVQSVAADAAALPVFGRASRMASSESPSNPQGASATTASSPGAAVAAAASPPRQTGVRLSFAERFSPAPMPPMWPPSASESASASLSMALKISSSSDSFTAVKEGPKESTTVEKEAKEAPAVSVLAGDELENTAPIASDVGASSADAAAQDAESKDALVDSAEGLAADDAEAADAADAADATVVAVVAVDAVSEAAEESGPAMKPTSPSSVAGSREASAERTLPGETPKEAISRRKRELAERELARLKEMTLNHIAEHPIRRRPSSVKDSGDESVEQTLRLDTPNSRRSSRGLSSRDSGSADECAQESLQQALRRRKQEQADREAERLKGVQPESVRRRPPAMPLSDTSPSQNSTKAAGGSMAECLQSPSPESPTSRGSASSFIADDGETPREAARRRKKEAADRDLARLKEAQAASSGSAREIAHRLRESHARSFTSPFATAEKTRRPSDPLRSPQASFSSDSSLERLPPPPPLSLITQPPAKQLAAKAAGEGELGSDSSFVGLNDSLLHVLS
eukprot:TRINITY_DN21885_c0_g5_i1.p1 TRINITY_DN21885_c0_g5~~TRINITY_DN21885_c0_g5_i1.p1  ORF type:complete len:728 (+),score=162.13 TRINITY_DN21885_c0_g5_i1:423-2606(+)